VPAPRCPPPSDDIAERSAHRAFLAGGDKDLARDAPADYFSRMRRILGCSALVFVMAGTGACGSAAPRAEEVRAADTAAAAGDRPYMHACAPDGSGQACDVDECVAWKADHGMTEEDALADCMQDCNCGE
jgi:hypothetical protein